MLIFQSNIVHTRPKPCIFHKIYVRMPCIPSNHNDYPFVQSWMKNVFSMDYQPWIHCYDMTVSHIEQMVECTGILHILASLQRLCMWCMFPSTNKIYIHGIDRFDNAEVVPHFATLQRILNNATKLVIQRKGMVEQIKKMSSLRSLQEHHVWHAQGKQHCSSNSLFLRPYQNASSAYQNLKSDKSEILILFRVLEKIHENITDAVSSAPLTAQIRTQDSVHDEDNTDECDLFLRTGNIVFQNATGTTAVRLKKEMIEKEKMVIRDLENLFLKMPMMENGSTMPTCFFFKRKTPVSDKKSLPRHHKLWISTKKISPHQVI